MVLSDFLSCVCFPSYPFKVSVYDEKNNVEKFILYVTDDDCFYSLAPYLDFNIIYVDFQSISILISDNQVHT